MSRYSDKSQRAAIESFCETLLGPEAGSLVDTIADWMERRIIKMESGPRRDIRKFLGRLSLRGGLVIYGGWNASFVQMPLARREKVLNRLLASREGVIPGVAQSLYRQVVYFAGVSGYASNRSEPLVGGDQGGNRSAETKEPFHVASLKPGQRDLACEWLVVGSGPAGSIMAAELAETGQKVLLVDQASLLPLNSQLTEYEGNRSLLETFGAWSNVPETIVLSAARTFGGGSVINWGTFIPPPIKVLRHWGCLAGFDFENSRPFQHSLFAVRRRYDLQQIESSNSGEAELIRGTRILGVPVEQAESNVSQCDGCSNCQFGCHSGRKRDMRSTWLVDAARLGVFLLPGCTVDRLELKNGTAVAAMARIREADGETTEVKIRFRHCVLAAGAIHSPSILLRSGHRNVNLGRNLSLHPTVILPAVFDTRHADRSGPIQTRYVDGEELESEAQRGEFIVENSFFPRGLAAMCLPWRSSREYESMLRSYDYWTGTMVLARDHRGGRVTCDAKGQPVVRYRLEEATRKSLHRGIQAAADILSSAGALAVYSPTWRFDARIGKTATSALDLVRDRHHRSTHMLKLWSAHQMSSCRMSDTPSRGVVDLSGQVYGLANVSICDSSVLPGPPGVNPVFTLSAISHFLAQMIKARHG